MGKDVGEKTFSIITNMFTAEQISRQATPG